MLAKRNHKRKGTAHHWQLADHSVGFFVLVILFHDSDLGNTVPSLWKRIQSGHSSQSSVSACLPISLGVGAKTKFSHARPSRTNTRQIARKLNKKLLPFYAPPASCASMIRPLLGLCWSFPLSSKQNKQIKIESWNMFHYDGFSLLPSEDELASRSCKVETLWPLRSLDDRKSTSRTWSQATIYTHANVNKCGKNKIMYDK